MSPQWSPPMIGGMTAAGVEGDLAEQAAAMEPADDRRDDAATTLGIQHYQKMPQWSPPMIGGMTGRRPVIRGNYETPQWSPPMIGGMTFPATSIVSAIQVAAM